MMIYNFEDKKVIARRIEKLCETPNKKELEKICDIIVEHNPNIQITSTNNGIFIEFHNLKNETYISLQKYFDSFNTTNTCNTDSCEKNDSQSEYKPYVTEEYPYEDISKLRFNNKEKNMLKKQKYNNAIQNSRIQLDGDQDNQDKKKEKNTIFNKKN